MCYSCVIFKMFFKSVVKSFNCRSVFNFSEFTDYISTPNTRTNYKGFTASIFRGSAILFPRSVSFAVT